MLPQTGLFFHAMQHKLNTFQRTILLWNEMHPYNAVHIVRIQRPLDVRRLTDIINNHLEHYRLANLVIDGGGKSLSFHGGSPDIRIHTLDGGDDPSPVLRGEIEGQLNTPFDGNGMIHPFRFFTVTEHSSFFLGVVYFHLIADAESIISIVKSITAFYMDDKKTGSFPVLDLYPSSCGRLLAGNLRYITRWIRTFPEHVTNIRQSFRPKYANLHDTAVGFSHFSIMPSEFHTLYTNAKAWNVTLNDMFLALLLTSLSPLASKRGKSRRRKKISVASIVNIRKDLFLKGSGQFGVFLSSFSVSHAVPEETGIERLVKDIHIETEKIKRNRLYIRSVAELRTAVFLIRSFFKKRKKRFYAKYFPLWGGITNINLNTLWSDTGNTVPVDYLRAVSTGHATPLVFSFTTVNDKINVGVSYRKTVFSEADIERIICVFRESAESPGKTKE